MARKEPIQVVGGAYSDDALPWTAQDCVNYIPVFAEKEGTRSPKMLRGAPGHSVFTADMDEAPVRGTHDCEGIRIAVTGTTAYLIAADGSATSLGTIPGVERVTIAHNQITGGHEIAFGNGQSGYVYNTADGTFGQITDEAFPGFRSVDFIDQYIIGVEPFGRYWFHSDLSDATSYSSIDRMQAEKQPDGIQQAIATGGDVFVLGKRSAQFFSNTGAATGTFANRDGTEMDVGAASPWTACRMDNSVYWLSNEGIVYRLEGYQPRRVSTHALEQAFSRADISKAFAFTFEDRGHKVYYLTVGGKTWGYDVATGEWHRRKSSGLDFWRMNNLVRWGRRWFGGDYTNGKLYLLDWALQDEAGDELERSRICPVIHDHQNALIVNMVELVFDTGMDSTSFPIPEVIVDSPSITGDVPDGAIGDSGTLQYVVTGGVLPYSDLEIQSGSLPPGATMDADGLVTYEYSAPGSYSWTVGGTDAIGQPFSVADAAEVSAPEWLLFQAGNQHKISPEGTDWSSAAQTFTLDGGSVLGPNSQSEALSVNGEVLFVSVSAGFGGVQHGFRDSAGDWWPLTTSAISASSGQLANSGTHWFIAGQSGSVCQVSSDGKTFANMAIGAQAVARSGSGMVFAYADGSSFDIVKLWSSAADGTGISALTSLNVGYNARLAVMASDGDSLLLALEDQTSANRQIKLHSRVAGVWAAHGTPFPTFTDAQLSARVKVHHDPVLGWFVCASNRIAHGATPGTIALDAQVFPQIIYGIGSDGGKVIVSGASGMLYSYTPGDGWVALSSGLSTVLVDVTPVMP